LKRAKGQYEYSSNPVQSSRFPRIIFVPAVYHSFARICATFFAMNRGACAQTFSFRGGAKTAGFISVCCSRERAGWRYSCDWG
jgi:hypothetical protein